ncbi:MAG: family 43 glycosylhydrolase [Candidatus Sumerlaeia bacterium]
MDTRQRRRFLFALALLSSLFSIPIFAQQAPPPLTPEEHQAKYQYERVEALFDTPLIDTAITKGPDGMYYLTGTSGSKREDGTVNFNVNDGIYLWKSSDLKSWEAMGKLVDRDMVKADVEDLGLLRTVAYRDEMEGLLAPEIHFVKDACYLTYSLKPCGAGLLKSTSGKPEGPYEDVGLMMKRGQDASLFADEDGSVYWVFGGGWIAKMNESMTALAEEPRLIMPHDGRKDLPAGAQILQVGTGGAFMFKKDGVYHLLAAAIHGRLGVPCYDTWVSTAPSLDGPWVRRKLAVAHGGQSTMFEGPDGQWYATFSGVDSRAALRERPAIVPVDWVGNISYYYPKNEPWPWKKKEVITEAWGWEHVLPISDLSYRDPVAVNGGDGFFYATGLHNKNTHGNKTAILKGKDLTGKTPWERIPIAGWETVDDVPWFKEPDGRVGFWVSMAKIFPAKNTFWITLNIPGGGRVLRSRSGSMAGPWEVAVDVGDPEPAGRRFHRSMVFEDYDGSLYGRFSELLWPATDDFSAPLPEQVPPTEDGYKMPFNARLQGYTHESSNGSGLFRGDVPIGHIYKIDGNYLMIGGAGWHGDYRSFGTYDSEVFWSTKIGGPWHPNYSVLPHGGNSGIFQDDDGTWWHIGFANDNFLPDGARLRCLPLEIKWNGAGYDIGPRHKTENPYVHHREVKIVDEQKKSAIENAYETLKLPADIPLRNPKITPVKNDGETIYYLTGTAGTKRPDGTMDFMNNDGVYLWKSTDLEHWESLGRVASIGMENNLVGSHPFHPMSYFFSPPDSLEPLYTRGIISPKLYKIKGDFWIVFSMSRQKVGILKSTSGKPEGPYELWGPVKGHGTKAFLLDCGIGSENNTDAYLFAYDPSLYVEDDGGVYVVFGPGWIAPLSDDMQTITERPVLLNLAGASTQSMSAGLSAGKGGCMLNKKDGLYYLHAETPWGDLVRMVSEKRNGPYAGPQIVFPQANGCGVLISENKPALIVKSEY